MHAPKAEDQDRRRPHWVGAVGAAIAGRSGGWARVAFIGLIAALLPAVIGSAPTPSALASGPEPWPNGAVLGDLDFLLEVVYEARQGPLADLEQCNAQYVLIAPYDEAQKAPAWKDPDTLFEAVDYCLTQDGATIDTPVSCRGVEGDPAFESCTAGRIARTHRLSWVPGDGSVFDPDVSYYTNRGYAVTAAMQGLYHAWVHDFAATEGPARPGGVESCDGATYLAEDAWDHRCYHKRMIRAYEAHMRQIIVAMIQHPDPRFQLDVTREIGLLAGHYARMVQTAEELGAWSPDNGGVDRDNALNVINGLAQRLWWDWVWTQQDGPRTYGVAQLGSQATFDDAAIFDSSWTDTDGFAYVPEGGGDSITIQSLRPEDPSRPGLFFDADYAMGGAWWCDRFVQPENKARCEVHSARLGTATAAGGNMGSIAEEWLWSFTGAHMTMELVDQLALASDGRDDLPVIDGAIGHSRGPKLPRSRDRPISAFAADRVGFGIAGWHGGNGATDDMEWLYSPTKDVVAIRTLSAASRAGDKQEERRSLGEAEKLGVLPDGADDTFAVDGQELPGAMENHLPGPSPLYASLLFQLMLGDKTSDGLSSSFYSVKDRNTADEFDAWTWLLRSALYRCTEAADPAVDCASDDSPFLQPLYARPDEPVPVGEEAFRYLWRDPGGGDPALHADHVGAAEATADCGVNTGVPWRRVAQRAPTPGPDEESQWIIDENGFGAYAHLVPILGGSMRLIAARYEAATQPGVSPDALSLGLLTRYGELQSQLQALLDLYVDPVGGFGYLPFAENGRCVDGSTMASLVKYSSDDIYTTVVERANAYAGLALWRWWMDDDWLDIDASVWDPGGSVALPMVAHVQASESDEPVVSGIQVQNLSDSPARIEMGFVSHNSYDGNPSARVYPRADLGGATNLTTGLNGSGQPVIKTSTLSIEESLPYGSFSALLRADRPIGALVRLDWPDSGGAALTDSPAAGKSVVVPYVVHKDGKETVIAVQNVGTVAGQVSVSLFDGDGSLVHAEPPRMVQPSAGRRFETKFMGIAPFEGTAWIDSLPQVHTPNDSEPPDLAAQVVVSGVDAPDGLRPVHGYAAVPLSEASTSLFVPLWRAAQRVDDDEASTVIHVMNPGTQSATVNVGFRYTDELIGGSRRCESVFESWTVLVPAGGSAALSQDPTSPPAGETALDEDCYGSAVIATSGGIGPPPEVAAVVVDTTSRAVGGELLASYRALALSAASTRVSLPLIRRLHPEGLLTTGIQVVNPSSVDTAEVALELRWAVGSGEIGSPQLWSASVPPGGSRAWWLESPEISFWMPGNAFGVGTVKSNVPVMVLVNDYPRTAGLDPATYLGLPRPE